MSELFQNPDFWVTLYIKHLSGTDVYTFATRPCADKSTYEHGWKPPLIKDTTTIKRSAATSRNQFEAASFAVTFYDYDGMFRAILRSTTKGILSQEAVAKLISRKARLLEQEPRIMIRGYVEDRSSPGGIYGMLVIKDALGSQLGPYGYDKQLPAILIGPPDIVGAPKELDGKQPAPMCYGEWNDAGTTLTDGTAYVKGRLPAYYGGDMIVSATEVVPVTGTSGQTLLSPPPAPGYTVTDGGGATHIPMGWSYALVAKTAYGRTTLGAGVYVPDLWSRSGTNMLILHFDDTHYVDLDEVLSSYPAAQQSQITGFEVYTKIGNLSTSSSWRHLATANPDGSYMDDGSGSLGSGPPSTNTALVSGTFTSGTTTITEAVKMRRFIVGQGYIKINNLYGPPVSSNQATTPKSGRVIIPLGSDDFIRPGHGSWPHADPWWISPDGRRFTVFYGAGPRADQAMLGTGTTLAVDACGYTENGNDNTAMIGDPFDQMVRLLNDFVYYNRGQGYKDGTWPILETWPGSTTVQVVNVESFQRASEYYQQRNGGNKLKGAIYLNSQVTIREVMRQFMQDYSCILYPDRHGRVSCLVIDEMQDFTNAQRLRDRIEIRRVLDPTYDDAGRQNWINYVFGWDPDTNTFVQKPTLITNQASFDFYGRWLKLQELTEIKFTNDANTARITMQHALLMGSYSLPTYPIELNYAPGANLEIGDPVLVTNARHGLYNEKMIVMDLDVVVPVPGKPGYVIASCLDIQRITTGWSPWVVDQVVSTPSNVWADADPNAVIRG